VFQFVISKARIQRLNERKVSKFSQMVGGEAQRKIMSNYMQGENRNTIDNIYNLVLTARLSAR